MDFTNIEESRPDGEQPLKFYYNREERLEKAPQVVQDFYSGKFKTNKGIKAIFRVYLLKKIQRLLMI